MHTRQAIPAQVQDVQVVAAQRSVRGWEDSRTKPGTVQRMETRVPRECRITLGAAE